MLRDQPPGVSGVFSGDAGEILHANMLWRADLIVSYYAVQKMQGWECSRLSLFSKLRPSKI